MVEQVHGLQPFLVIVFELDPTSIQDSDMLSYQQVIVMYKTSRMGLLEKVEHCSDHRHDLYLRSASISVQIRWGIGWMVNYLFCHEV